MRKSSIPRVYIVGIRVIITKLREEYAIEVVVLVTIECSDLSTQTCFNFGIFRDRIYIVSLSRKEFIFPAGIDCLQLLRKLRVSLRRVIKRTVTNVGGIGIGTLVIVQVSRPFFSCLGKIVLVAQLCSIVAEHSIT